MPNQDQSFEDVVERHLRSARSEGWSRGKEQLADPYDYSMHDDTKLEAAWQDIIAVHNAKLLAVLEGLKTNGFRLLSDDVAESIPDYANGGVVAIEDIDQAITKLKGSDSASTETLPSDIPRGQTFKEATRSALVGLCDAIDGYHPGHDKRIDEALLLVTAAHEADKEDTDAIRYAMGASEAAVRAALEGLMQEPHAHTHGYCTLCEAVAHKLKALDQPTGGEK